MFGIHHRAASAIDKTAACVAPSRSTFALVYFASAVALAGCAGYEPPQADTAPTTQAIKKLPRKSGERVAVTIYEFRSGLSDASARGATDIFKTALVQSGQFTVVERARLNEGVGREKQLNQAGATTGRSGTTQLRGAAYIFEGAVTEANSSESQNSTSVGVRGLQIGGGSNRDSIAIDVRIVDASNGDVVDVVSVRKAIASNSVQISGIGEFLNSVLASRGKSSPNVPDVQTQQQKREGVDSALRDAINQAVLELAKRFAS
jgi:curli biogenesis system outer membrane secretion channel CsgG